MSYSSLSRSELERRIAIVRDNIRQLIEQAAAVSGAGAENRNADRIAQQNEELERLTSITLCLAARMRLSRRAISLSLERPGWQYGASPLDFHEACPSCTSKVANLSVSSGNLATPAGVERAWGDHPHSTQRRLVVDVGIAKRLPGGPILQDQGLTPPLQADIADTLMLSQFLQE